MQMIVSLPHNNSETISVRKRNDYTKTFAIPIQYRVAELLQSEIFFENRILCIFPLRRQASSQNLTSKVVNIAMAAANHNLSAHAMPALIINMGGEMVSRLHSSLNSIASCA